MGFWKNTVWLKNKSALNYVWEIKNSFLLYLIRKDFIKHHYLRRNILTRISTKKIKSSCFFLVMNIKRGNLFNLRANSTILYFYLTGADKKIFVLNTNIHKCGAPTKFWEILLSGFLRPITASTLWTRFWIIILAGNAGDFLMLA